MPKGEGENKSDNKGPNNKQNEKQHGKSTHPPVHLWRTSKTQYTDIHDKNRWALKKRYDEKGLINFG